MKLLLTVMFTLSAATATIAADKSESVSSDDLVGSFPKIRIIGPLGVVLGKYVTIEGKACFVDWQRKEHLLSPEQVIKRGIPGLKVYKVDGVKLKAPVYIQFTEGMQAIPAPNYTIRGYQTGAFGPEQVDPDDVIHTGEVTITNGVATTTVIYPDDAPKTDFKLTVLFVAKKNLTDRNEKKTNTKSEPEGSR